MSTHSAKSPASSGLAMQQVPPTVDVDPDPAEENNAHDIFSNYGTSLPDSTTTANSEVYDWQWEHGRRYHAYRRGKYLLPNDAIEQDRLDMTHHIFRLLLNGNLCLTKLENPRRILDVGTGTGIWAIEIGDTFPEAEVTGIDLSPTQPPFVPPNVKFYIEDCTDEWTFPRNHFDFIHVRTMIGGISDWPKFLRQCYDHLAPGGKLEISEGRANFWYPDESVPETSYTYQWLMEWRTLSARMRFDVFCELPEMIGTLPFQNMQTVEKICPLGTWPKDQALKEVGRWYKAQFLEMGLEAYTLALFTRVGGWRELEVRTLLAFVREEMQKGRMHLYTFCSYLTAEKPMPT